MAILKSVLSILAGIVLASLSITAVEALAHGRLTGDALFAAVAAGYGIGAFVGTAASARLANSRTATFVPAVLALLAAMNLFAFPHPWWFAIAAMVTLALGWRAGLWLAKRSRGSAS